MQVSLRNSYIGLGVYAMLLGLGSLLTGGDRTDSELQALGAASFLVGFVVMMLLEERDRRHRRRNWR